MNRERWILIAKLVGIVACLYFFIVGINGMSHSFKLFGKRVFRMAPLHHHFELKGWPEPRVSVRFWIISLILVLVGLATLKVR